MSPTGWRFWERWSTAQKVSAAVVLVATGAAIGHQAAFFGWYIEDAAISFAYAKHLVEGEGLVAFPGGERVEGYSNFTWVMVLALLHLMGADGFASADWLALGCVAATVPIVWLTMRAAMPGHLAPAIGAVGALAACSQFAHWGGSGLENALFSLLMALALWRTVVELRDGGWPWSALAWFGLSISRPEAILYAAVAGFSTMVFHLNARRGVLPTIMWLATFFVPWGAYQAWRFWYFAWEFPNTYYAKMNNKEPTPFEWNKRGWKYVRNWAHANGTGYLLPVYLLGLLGGRGWRVMAVIGASFVAAFAVNFGSNARVLFPAVVVCTYAMFYGSVRANGQRPRALVTGLSALAVVVVAGAAELALLAGLTLSEPPTPGWWSEVPSYTFMLLAAALPVLVAPPAGRPAGAQLRVLTWVLAAVGLFFAIYVQGDWMANWRWLSLPAVPMCMLFGFGVHAAGELIEDLFHTEGDRWHIAGWLGAAAVLGLFVGPNAAQSDRAKRDTNPYSVLRRVEYVQGVARTLHLRERPRLLDVDMGAHMYWSGFVLHDIAGLIDVPLAQHKFERPFVREYLFEESRPHFAHVHAGWASTSRIPTHSEWRRDYVEIPGYPAGPKQFHIGNHVRRDLLFAPRWPGGDTRRVTLDDGISLAGWRAPSPLAAPNRKLYLEVGVDCSRRRTDDTFRVIAFLANARGTVATWDLPPAYDWVEPADWGAHDVFLGKFALPVPEDLPHGTYDLGFVVFGTDGRVVAPAPEPTHPKERAGWARSVQAIVGGVDADARIADGEVRFADAIRVVSIDERIAAADEDLAEARDAVADDRCREAEEAWSLALAHRPTDRRWLNATEPVIARELAECWARTSVGRDAAEAVERLARARGLDHRAPSIAGAAAPVADALQDAGMAAYAAEDWESAFRQLSDVMRIAPHRSWARRYAELARAKRLGIDPETKAAEEAERQRKRDELEARAAARAAEREAAGPERRDATAPRLPRRGDDE